ncbi:MAG TPA: hypothetical protein PLP42_01710 [Acidobacteriota bacterium]|nr:hypothetical protein [Acidobacteriota bacterium]
MSARTCECLFLLVGSNPLPNYLAALILKPKAVRLFYSPETRAVKDHLEERLKAALPNVCLDDKYIHDVTSAEEVAKAFDDIPPDAHLHYSGGTKVLAAHARMAFREILGEDALERASYMDERKGLLRFDSGCHLDLSEQKLDLTLDYLLALHGIKRHQPRSPQTGDPTESDAMKIAIAGIRNPTFARTLYRIHRLENGKRVPFDKASDAFSSLHEALSRIPNAPQIPEAYWKEEETFETWSDFCEWLEVWCGSVLRRILSENQIVVDLNCTLANGRECQIDVAVVRGHRLYLISCTTDTTIGICKSKLFEVAMRARQLGGDLARSALVCLIDGCDSKETRADKLRKDVAALWDAPNTPEVFGRDDLMEWVGVKGNQPLQSLESWLDS